MRILLDQDGLTFDFVSAYLDAVYALTGVIVSRYEVTQWDFKACPFQSRLPENTHRRVCNAISQRGFCRRIPLLPGAREGVDGLRQRGHEVIALTSPWSSSPYWEEERVEACRDKLGFYAREVIFSHAKEEVAGDCFVDDRPENVIAWLKSHDKPAFVWHTHANKGHPDNLPRVYGWNDLYRAIDL